MADEWSSAYRPLRPYDLMAYNVCNVPLTGLSSRHSSERPLPHSPSGSIRANPAALVGQNRGGKRVRLKDMKFLRARAPKRGRCRRISDRRAALLGTIVQVRTWKAGTQKGVMATSKGSGTCAIPGLARPPVP